MPRKLVIRTGYSYMDGGTVRLHTSDQDDRPHLIEIPRQYYAGALPAADELIPGRLYFDHVLVDIRSSMEMQLMDLLRQAPIIPHPFEDAGVAGVDPGRDSRDENILQALVSEVISFVQSDHYVESARPR